MAGYRPKYTREEEIKIINYIIDNEGQYMLRGNVIWKDMESSGEFERTWQSLKEHFRKKIYPNLNQFRMFNRDLQSIQVAYEPTSTISPHFRLKRIEKRLTMFFVSDSDSD